MPITEKTRFAGLFSFIIQNFFPLNSSTKIIFLHIPAELSKTSLDFIRFQNTINSLKLLLN